MSRATSSKLFVWIEDPAIHMDPTTPVGILGGIAALTLFLSPAPSFYYRIWRSRGNTTRNRGEEYSASVVPYLAGLLNCGLWVLYGLPVVHPHRIPIITANAIGFGVQMAYLALLLVVTNSIQRRLRLVVIVAAELVFLAALAILVIKLAHTTRLQSSIIGSFCIPGSIAYYASHLAVMIKNVIKTKRVEHIPFEVAYLLFFNGLIWATYAITPLDVFVLIPNSIGCVLGLVQMALHVSVYIREELVRKAVRPAVYIRDITRGVIDVTSG